MSTQPSTDKDVLRKGITRLFLCLPFIIMGIALINKGARHDHPIIFLMPGIAFCILAVVFMFQGITTIADAMFKSNKRR